MWGYLDYAFASDALREHVQSVVELHVDADEPAVLDYNTEFKSTRQQSTLYAPDAFRASDHDPVVIGLELHGGCAIALPGTSRRHGDLFGWLLIAAVSCLTRRRGQLAFALSRCTSRAVRVRAFSSPPESTREVVDDRARHRVFVR
jgi:hypothetical protein